MTKLHKYVRKMISSVSVISESTYFGLSTALRGRCFYHNTDKDYLSHDANDM